MSALYNEIDPYAAQWLNSLIAAGHIAPGVVEQRSVVDLKPADVAGPGQRHFFAGIGGWSYALRLAGVRDDADIWTGSCPCQPFSDAGKGRGVRDPRHLWPTWFELIRKCRPPTIFGEQVASRDGLAWLDLVRSDLEGCGYAVGASDLCAASVGAPHIRQRLYFVAHAGGQRREGFGLRVQPRRSRSRRPEVGGAARLALPHELGDSSRARSRRNAGGLSDAQASSEGEGREPGRVADELVDAGELADAQGRGRSRRVTEPHGWKAIESTRPLPLRAMANTSAGPVEQRLRREQFDENNLRRPSSRSRGERDASQGALDPWSDCEWLPCSDGVSRPVEPGTFPLAHGVSGRVVICRAVESASTSVEEEHWYNRTGAIAGFGNAIVPQVAAVFIEAAIAANGDE